MKIHKDDKVKVITGKDKGKVGKVLKVYLTENKVLVEGVNLVTKHVKPNNVNKEGGIVKIERPINAANVMYFDDKSQKPVRVGYLVKEGKKYRINKSNKEAL